MTVELTQVGAEEPKGKRNALAIPLGLSVASLVALGFWHGTTQQKVSSAVSDLERTLTKSSTDTDKRLEQLAASINEKPNRAEMRLAVLEASTIASDQISRNRQEIGELGKEVRAAVDEIRRRLDRLETKQDGK